MPILQLIHDRLSITVLLFMLALGLWGIWSSLRGEGVSGSYWGALAVGEILLVAEGVLGMSLFLGGLRPARTAIHILYGVFLALAIPGVFSFTRGRATRQEALIYGLVALFLAGVTVRARITGGG